MEMQKLSLFNICGEGAVDELFERELKTVLQNIADVNTDPEKTRKIVLEFKIEPDKGRKMAKVTFACTSKTVAVDSVSGIAYITNQNNKVEAYTQNPDQGVLAMTPPVNENKN